MKTDNFVIQCIRKVFSPIDFPQFVMLQPYSKMDSIVFVASSNYTQYTIMTKQKLFFGIFTNV